ncbi:putative Mg2+ transporter-C (MgtC) family protein [Phenylobacterium haematophilum]|uniref:Protein MgtC n=1 Tax=Phenylobacterium haematophilum TaxID=98513 RepID=A0A840A3R1_9CAUL|nr:MgtC/SapB family protein [Phenylobacterium haematophilum]MBB3893018.1 putative Mg2+ transporter-C (MgtC) family protein [Phenylobacterium haematophilum]
MAESPWYLDIFRIALAALLGCAIGWQRERRGRDAGIRTYMATVLGSCAFGLISGAIGDQGRIAVGVVTGIGFIGAGVILRDGSRVTGLTTAATLWASTAVGLSTAYGLYHLAVIAAVLILGVLELPRVPGWSRFSMRARVNASSDRLLRPEVGAAIRPRADDQRAAEDKSEDP